VTTSPKTTKTPVTRKTAKSVAKASSLVVKTAVVKTPVTKANGSSATRSNLVMACKAAGVDPKTVRAHLRRAGIAKPYDPTQDAIRDMIALVATRKH
jgi:hypothetical protein